MLEERCLKLFSRYPISDSIIILFTMLCYSRYASAADFHMLSRLVGLSWKRYIWRGFRPSAMTGSSSSASLRDDSKEKLRFTALVALVPLVASAIFTFFAFVPTLTSRRKKPAASWRIGTPRQSPLSLSEAHVEFAVVSASETEGGSELER